MLYVLELGKIILKEFLDFPGLLIFSFNPKGVSLVLWSAYLFE